VPPVEADFGARDGSAPHYHWYLRPTSAMTALRATALVGETAN
jgi:hypothetical protein